MEVELFISVLQTSNIVAGVITQVSVMVMTTDLDDNLFMVVSDELEIPFVVLFGPELVVLVAIASVLVIQDNNFSLISKGCDQLLLKPVENLALFAIVSRRIVTSNIHRVHLEHSELASNVSTIVACSGQAFLNLRQIKRLVSSEVCKPQFVQEIVVIRFIALIDGLIVEASIVVAKGWQDHSVREVLSEHVPRILQVLLNCVIRGMVRIITL